jgi:hypothetical protein
MAAQVEPQSCINFLDGGANTLPWRVRGAVVVNQAVEQTGVEIEDKPRAERDDKAESGRNAFAGTSGGGL